MSQTASDRLDLAVNVTGAVTGAAQRTAGGRYLVLCSGTIGVVTLQIQNPHGDWVDHQTAVDSGAAIYDLPAGQTRVTTDGTAAGAYVYAIRVPR